MAIPIATALSGSVTDWRRIEQFDVSLRLARPAQLDQILLHCSMQPVGEHARFYWRTSQSVLICVARAEVALARARRVKWPGKHQRSLKCRSAWKSTCMRAPPANKR